MKARVLAVFAATVLVGADYPAAPIAFQGVEITIAAGGTLPRLQIKAEKWSASADGVHVGPKQGAFVLIGSKRAAAVIERTDPNGRGKGPIMARKIIVDCSTDTIQAIDGVSANDGTGR